MTVKTNKLVITNSNATEDDAVITSSGAGNLDVDKMLKLSASDAYTANGSGSVFLAQGSQLGPNTLTAAGSGVAKWLTVEDSNGTKLYIPAWE